MENLFKRIIEIIQRRVSIRMVIHFEKGKIAKVTETKDLKM